MSSKLIEHQTAMEEGVDQEGPAILRECLRFARERLSSGVRAAMTTILVPNAPIHDTEPRRS
jgi:hypothetical protein